MSDDKPIELMFSAIAAAASLKPLDEPIVPARFFSAVPSLPPEPAQFSRPFAPFEFPLSPGVQRSSYDLGRVREVPGIASLTQTARHLAAFNEMARNDWDVFNAIADRDPIIRDAIAAQIDRVTTPALRSRLPLAELQELAEIHGVSVRTIDAALAELDGTLYRDGNGYSAALLAARLGPQPIKRSPTCGTRSRELRTALRELGEVEDILHDTIESGRVSALMSTASPDTVTELMRLANDVRDIIKPDLAFVRLGDSCRREIQRVPGKKPKIVESISRRLRTMHQFAFRHTVEV